MVLKVSSLRDPHYNIRFDADYGSRRPMELCGSIKGIMERPNASAGGKFVLGGDLPVHRLGYGTMRLVGEGAWGEPRDPEEARRVLRRTVELGVNLIDTADAYGPEIAERLIAEALYPYPSGIVIATKGGITRQGPAQTEYVGRAGYLIQCVEMSLRRLRLERIELYQLHRIDPRTPLEESLGALYKMQEQGKIRHVGLSEVTPEQIEAAQKIVPVVTVQNRYSLADRRHEATLTWCEQRGIGFVPWYPMAGGKLLKPEHSAIQALARIAARHSATAAQLSIAWLLHRSAAMLPIPGTSKVTHLEENIAAARLQLEPTEWAELESATSDPIQAHA
jgi:aryl-alcohol dehydrogenase-like predicted oxidoreductase